MTKTPLKNIAASVRRRLFNKSRSDIQPFQELVQYYAMERFLYRLSLSRHSNRLILKGALMLRIWKAPSELPSILDFAAPRLLCYSRETAIAEKFEAMLKVRELNSRMKDFYDIWLISRQFGFDGKTLSEAIRLTLAQRGTELPNEIVAFSQEFIMSKRMQWNAFRKKLEQDHLPAEFEHIVVTVKEFIDPIASALASRKPPPSRWSAPGPWV